MRVSRFFVCVVLSALAGLAPCAFGQQVGITMNSSEPYVMNGIYVGPYNATVNGQSAQIICDDFADDTYLNQSWTANVTTFSNLTSWRSRCGASSTPTR